MPELAKWDNFYVIVGSAAGALIGLQFVVLTLIADKPPVGAEETGAAFGSPTIVHFSVALLMSALLHAPWQTITLAAECWGLVGFGGLAYTAIVIGRMLRQPVYKPQFEDWLFHSALPFIAYTMLAISAFRVSSHTHDALFGVGGAVLLLLFIGIHNAWDNVACWSTLRVRTGSVAKMTANESEANDAPSVRFVLNTRTQAPLAVEAGEKCVALFENFE